MNIKVINSDKTYKCILTYHDDEYNTDYMLYTDNSYNKDNSLKVYLSKYNPLSKEMIAQAIEDKKEYKKIKTIMNSILLNMNNQQ